MCLHFYLVLFEQVGYSMFLVQYRKVFSDQYSFLERADLAFALLYVYCVLRRMGGIFYLVSRGVYLFCQQLSKWLALFPDVINIQKRKQKRSYRHRTQKLKRLVGKTIPSTRVSSQTLNSAISQSS